MALIFLSFLALRIALEVVSEPIFSLSPLPLLIAPCAKITAILYFENFFFLLTGTLAYSLSDIFSIFVSLSRFNFFSMNHQLDPDIVWHQLICSQQHLLLTVPRNFLQYYSILYQTDFYHPKPLILHLPKLN